MIAVTKRVKASRRGANIKFIDLAGPSTEGNFALKPPQNLIRVIPVIGITFRWIRVPIQMVSEVARSDRSR